MASIGRNQCILVLLLIVTFWTSQVMPRKLNAASLSERHEQWMAKYGKIYKDAAEKENRFQIFKNNVELIESFNAAGNKPYKLSTNQFADQTNEEFKSSHNGYKRINGLSITTETPFWHGSVSSVPATIDWRKRGAVTPNQESRHMCWVYSSVAATEGIHAITTGKLVSLSEQELIDCDTNGKSQECEGGSIEDGFEFIVKHGITSEANYPVREGNGTCNTQKENSPVAHIKGYEKVPSNNEEALLLAVAHQPVSVAIDAGSNVFQFYSGGVLSGDCGTVLDHAAAVVGYGVTNDGTNYWIVKNSWGTAWGEEGYIRMKRGIDAKEGLCGIAMDASYPIA
ncbi:Peptidase C1A, papain C-terminal [Sesbania bispinosa]|nr:Peptidase C1A, papain C-terminal [Sesbania bispinosa]